MKKILNILLIVFTFSGLLFTSCEKEAGESLPGPDLVTASNVLFSTSPNPASDGSVNLFTIKSLNLSYNIVHLQGDYSSVKLMCSTNHGGPMDFTTQYVVKDLSSLTFPADVTLDANDLVNACDFLDDTTDIEPGLQFTFYINAVGVDGLNYNTYDPKSGIIRISSGLSNNPDYNFSINVLAAYPYIPANFVGLYDVVETTSGGDTAYYQSEVSIDPDRPETGLICTDIWWYSTPEFPCSVKVYVNPSTYSVMGDDQIIWGGDAYELGRVGISDFTAGLCNTATSSFWFAGTPDLPDTGYWWGVSGKWELTPAATTKKSTNLNTMSNKINKIVKK